MSIPRTFQELAGYDLGRRTVGWSERDAILYALACGAGAGDLDLVYERDLRTLPGIVAALGLWAVEQCGDLGVYDRKKSLHVSQGLVIHHPLPPSGDFETRGRVTGVWDKGKATIIDIEVASDAFTASYSIFLPGVGGWGGPQPPAAPKPEAGIVLKDVAQFQTSPDQAVLYRLTGDLHPVHVDFEVARGYGFERPILHGLCTLGIALRLLGPAFGRHPADLAEAGARLSAPVLPGDLLSVHAADTGKGFLFEVTVADRVVLKDGFARFS